MPKHPPGIDQEKLQNLLHDTLGDTVEVYLQILQMFLAETPKSLAALAQAIQSSDLAQVAHLSHTLKSNGLSLGASRFSELCQQIEQQARSGKAENLAGWCSQLREEFEICRVEVEKERRRIG